MSKTINSDIAGYIPKRPPKSEGQRPFKIVSDYQPAGDQPSAINALCKGIEQGQREQILLGVTGSGKTFTMANIIHNTQRPALIMAPNKTLAAQLYEEFRSFFPDNAVEYFVSYYDYYQPEAYVPRSDTYIAKESTVNEQIDRMRHSATRSLLERDDVIIVSSVSCIYGIGSAECYGEMIFDITKEQEIPQQEILAGFVNLHYRRNDVNFQRGFFRVRGDTIEIWPSHLESQAWRICLWGNTVDELSIFDPLTGVVTAQLDFIRLYANSHYVTPRPALQQAIAEIKKDLALRLEELASLDKKLEAQRLEQRAQFDLEMLITTGSCQGIENYSRYLTGRPSGNPPPTLFEYLPDNALLFCDESHITVPQIGAMYQGDRKRKSTLVEHGFRLPSCLDNRPLKFEEWDGKRPQSILVSATPGKWEMAQTDGAFTEQIIRPTGLIDPEIEVRPASEQVDDLLYELKKVIAQGWRVLATTLTKKMAENLTEFIHERNIRVRYMHSDIETLERIEIIRDLRLGKFDVLVGINLLREGLDIPECALVAVLDADKEGFLRSASSLIQVIGRAARNSESRVILYGDRITASMEAAIQETERRRTIQQAYNTKHNITPTTVIRSLKDNLSQQQEEDDTPYTKGKKRRRKWTAKDIPELERRMQQASDDLDFEQAAALRDEILRLKGKKAKS